MSPEIQHTFPLSFYLLTIYSSLLQVSCNPEFRAFSVRSAHFFAHLQCTLGVCISINSCLFLLFTCLLLPGSVPTKNSGSVGRKLLPYRSNIALFQGQNSLAQLSVSHSEHSFDTVHESKDRGRRNPSGGAPGLP